LKTFVNNTNVEELKLNELVLADVEGALGTYDLTDEQQKDATLDVLTGFQLATPDFRIAVVEGLADGNLQVLRDHLGHPTEPGFRSLFDSSETFLDRLYGLLGPSVASIFVDESLPELVTRSEIYVKGGRGWGCLDGFSQIQSLFEASQFHVAVRDKLLPSSSSLLTISGAYGGVPTAAMLPFVPEGPVPAAPIRQATWGGTAKFNATARISTQNPAYDTLRVTQRRGSPTNYLLKNTGMVGDLSTQNTMQNAEHRRLNETITQQAGEAVHNYSTQTFNSAALAQERMREMILDDIQTGRRPKALYTYDVSGEFHHSAASAVLVPDAPKPGKLDAGKTLQRKPEPEKWLDEEVDFDTTARHVVDLGRQFTDPHATQATKPFAELLATGRSDFPWELREKDFDNLMRKPANTTAVQEYGLLDAGTKPGLANPTTTQLHDPEAAKAGPIWKSTMLSREPPSLHRQVVDAYNDEPKSMVSSGGSLLSTAVALDVSGPRSHLVHNSRAVDKIGRQFPK
jgi:hypothetical protein